MQYRFYLLPPFFQIQLNLFLIAIDFLYLRLILFNSEGLSSSLGLYAK